MGSKENQIKHYSEKMLEVLDYFKVSGQYSYKGCEANVKAWLNNKNDLISHLRRHPDWNEEAKAIIFKCRCEIEGDWQRTKELFKKLYLYIISKIPADTIDKDWNRCTRKLLALTSNKCLSRYDAYELNWLINNYDAFDKRWRFEAGMKVSRVINKFFSRVLTKDGEIVDATKLTDEHEKDDRDYQSYDKLFAKLSDALNPPSKVQTIILSANILDFLTMSHGNSWSSCHYINDDSLYHDKGGEHTFRGCYKAGTLSYANDAVSMIFYALPEDCENTDYHLQQKIARQVFCYTDGMLLQSRLYPNHGSVVLNDWYRKIVQEILAQCYYFPNDWENKEMEDCHLAVYSDDYTYHYRDFIQYSDECTFSEVKNYSFLYCPTEPEHYKSAMSVGGTSYCIDCGKPKEDYTYNDERFDDCDEDECPTAYLQCETCHNIIICPICGKKIDRNSDSWRWFNGKRCCLEHLAYCDYHSKYELYDPEKHHPYSPRNYALEGEEIYVCEEGIESGLYCYNDDGKLVNATQSELPF